MTIQSTKTSMGFQSANQRPSCKNCLHAKEQFADRSPPFDTRSWHCKKGGFATNAMASCDQHQPKA